MNLYKGITLLEVLVSVALLSIVVAAIFPIIGWLSSRSAQLKYSDQAAAVLQESMEASYNAMLNNWTAYPADTSISLKKWHPETISDLGGLKWRLVENADVVSTRFTRYITIEQVCRNVGTGVQSDCNAGHPVDQNSKQVTAHVEWQEQGKTRSVQPAKLLVVKM